MFCNILRIDAVDLPDIEINARVWRPTHFAIYFCTLITRFARERGTVLDVGSGSGILAIYGALKKSCQAYALDIQRESVRQAFRNARKLGIPLKVINQDADSFLRTTRMRFSCVVANTPSYPDGFYPQSDGSVFIARGNGSGNRLLISVLSNASQVIEPGGVLITCVHSGQNIPGCVRLARDRFRKVSLFAIQPPVASRPVFKSMENSHIAKGAWIKSKGGEIYVNTVFIIASP